MPLLLIATMKRPILGVLLQWLSYCGRAAWISNDTLMTRCFVVWLFFDSSVPPPVVQVMKKRRTIMGMTLTGTIKNGGAYTVRGKDGQERIMISFNVADELGNTFS